MTNSEDQSLKVSNLSCYALDGKKICDIPTTNITYDPLDVHALDPSIPSRYLANTNFSFTAEIVEDNLDIDDNFILDASKFPEKYDVAVYKCVQVRTHKKKRINKKWRRRYGVRIVQEMIKGWKIHCLTNGSFEFVKK